MKDCPHCGGQLRPSVIRCTHCGTSLIDERRGDATTPATTTHVGGRRPAAAPPAVPIPTAKARTEAETPPRAVKDDAATPWARPSVRTPRPPAPDPLGTDADLTGIPRADLPLMLSGVLAATAGAVAYSSLSMPWVRARISDAGSGTGFVAELTFRGTDSIAGRVGIGLAVALGLLGILWFWYGLDRYAHLPRIAHPTSAFAIALIAAAALAFAGIGSAAWRNALLEYARDVGLTRRAMQDLLDARTAPAIVVERVGGVLRFGVAAGLALLAGALAWWAERRRDESGLRASATPARPRAPSRPSRRA